MIYLFQAQLECTDSDFLPKFLKVIFLIDYAGKVGRIILTEWLQSAQNCLIFVSLTSFH